MVFKLNTHLIVHVLSLLVDCHHLLFMKTTTVTPVEILVQTLLFSQPILCGMVKVAPVEIIIVLNPACHGSIVSCH